MRSKTNVLLWNIAGCALVVIAGPATHVFGLAGLIPGCSLALFCFYRADRLKSHATVPAGDSKPYVSPFKVEFDDVEVRVTHEGKLRESVRWAEVSTVAVHIDDSFLPEPWWVLFNGPESGCMYPSSALGGQDMLAAMQARLPGFDNAAVIESMGLMEGGRQVWSKQSTQQRVQEDGGQQREQAGERDGDHHQ